VNLSTNVLPAVSVAVAAGVAVSIQDQRQALIKIHGRFLEIAGEGVKQTLITRRLPMFSNHNAG